MDMCQNEWQDLDPQIDVQKMGKWGNSRHIYKILPDGGWIKDRNGLGGWISAINVSPRYGGWAVGKAMGGSPNDCIDGAIDGWRRNKEKNDGEITTCDRDCDLLRLFSTWVEIE